VLPHLRRLHLSLSLSLSLSLTHSHSLCRIVRVRPCRTAGGRRGDGLRAPASATLTAPRGTSSSQSTTSTSTSAAVAASTTSTSTAVAAQVPAVPAAVASSVAPTAATAAAAPSTADCGEKGVLRGEYTRVATQRMDQPARKASPRGARYSQRNVLENNPSFDEDRNTMGISWVAIGFRVAVACLQTC
jgi:hypothetical protein